MLMSVSAGARALGVSAEHVRRMIRSGKWPFYKLGPKTTRIDTEEIKALGKLLAEVKQSQNHG